MGTDYDGNLQRISLLRRGLDVAPKMASASHVESVPVLIDDLNSSEAHVNRFGRQRISRNGEASGDVSPKPRVGTVTGIVFDNRKAVEVDMLALINSFFDWRALVGYSDFARCVQGFTPR